jgi:uncharacterized membrane-anchored protein YitT (DUF2179 family)
MELLQKIEKKNLFIRYLLLILLMFVSALVFNLFLRKNNITTGGVNGVAIILEKLLHFDPAMTIFFLSLVLLILSFFLLSKEETIANIGTTFLYPFFVKITGNITDLIKIDNSNMLVICLYAGILGGISSGIIYKIGFSNGGFSIINQLLRKYFSIPISKSIFFLNAIIVIAGGFIFGCEMVLYAIVILYINSYIVNKIMQGISSNKVIYIVSKKEESIIDYLKEQELSFTIFKAKDAYTGNDRNAIFIVVPNNTYFALVNKLKTFDKNIFFVVIDSYQLNKSVN